MSSRPPAWVHWVSVFVEKVLPWIAAIGLVLAVRSAALALSGQETTLGAWLELTSRVRVSRGFALVFGGLALLYGLQQRNLRRLETRRLAARIAELERR
jgi:hypothetical protein